MPRRHRLKSTNQEVHSSVPGPYQNLTTSRLPLATPLGVPGRDGFSTAGLTGPQGASSGQVSVQGVQESDNSQRALHLGSHRRASFDKCVPTVRCQVSLRSHKNRQGRVQLRNDERIQNLNTHFIKDMTSTFVVRVMRDYMEGAGISDGDELIVNRALTPKDGSIVIAVLEGGVPDLFELCWPMLC